MPEAKLYLTPDPEGNADFVERAGVIEYDGAARAGDLVALDDKGLLETSIMPFAQSQDLGSDDAVDTVRFPVRADGPTGTGWRWFGLVSILNWVRDQLMDAISPVGTVRLAVGTETDGRWLYMDGRTVGADVSGAVLSGDDYRRLYFFLWNSISDDNIGMTLPSGLPASKGESAEADWISGKRVPLPSPESRFLLVGGAGKSLSRRAVGDVGGVEEVGLTALQMPKHTHQVEAAKAGVPRRLEYLSGVRVAEFEVTSQATTELRGTPTAEISAAQVEPHTHTGTVTTQLGDQSHTHTVQVASKDLSHKHDTSDPGVTVQTTSLGTDSQTLTTSGPSSGHSHSGSINITGTASSSGHTHRLQFTAGYTADTVVNSTPRLTLTPSHGTVDIYSVSSGGVTTSEAGGGSSHNNMPPFFTVAAFIRY